MTQQTNTPAAMLSPEEIERLTTICELATEGPWSPEFVMQPRRNLNNVVFISTARTALPAALAHIAWQNSRIAELEKQLQTAPIKALIEMYDAGHSDIDASVVHGQIQSYLMLWEHLPVGVLSDVAEIWGRWEDSLSASLDFSDAYEFIDEIRAAIGMEKPEPEGGEQG